MSNCCDTIYLAYIKKKDVRTHSLKSKQMTAQYLKHFVIGFVMLHRELTLVNLW